MHMPTIQRFIFPLLFVCHLLFTLFSFYSFYGNYAGFTLYHWRPWFLLGYTIFWALMLLKQKWAVWVYLLLCMFDAACHFVYRKEPWGEALENTLFPVSILFLAVAILLYKSHFNSTYESR